MYDKEYYQKNRIRIRLAYKRYYLRHKEQICGKVRRVYLRDPKRKNIANREYINTHPDKRKVWRRTFYLANTDKVLLWSRRRRVLKHNVGGSHTDEQWEHIKKDYDNTCPMCLRSEPEIQLTRDHIIPITKGGTDDILNIQPLCRPCNSRKGTKVWIALNGVDNFFRMAYLRRLLLRRLLVILQLRKSTNTMTTCTTIFKKTLPRDDTMRITS